MTRAVPVHYIKQSIAIALNTVLALAIQHSTRRKRLHKKWSFVAPKSKQRDPKPDSPILQESVPSFVKRHEAFPKALNERSEASS